MTVDQIMKETVREIWITTSYLGTCDKEYSWQTVEVKWFLTRFGDSSDWKWKRTPAFAIWFSHLLLASQVSISFSLLLSNIWFKAAMSCSEKAQTVATRLWQKTMSLRSCVSLSVIQRTQRQLWKLSWMEKSNSLRIYTHIFHLITTFKWKTGVWVLQQNSTHILANLLFRRH